MIISCPLSCHLKDLKKLYTDPLRTLLKWHVNGSLSVLSECLKDEGNKHLMSLRYT